MASSPPRVRLGDLADDGIAPGIYALVARGAERRPDLARSLEGTVAFRFEEGFAAVRVTFSGEEILVEDAEGESDVEIRGALPAVCALTVTPTVAGVPSPLNPRGRAALGHLATGRVQIDGSRALGRRLLALLQLA